MKVKFALIFSPRVTGSCEITLLLNEKCSSTNVALTTHARRCSVLYRLLHSSFHAARTILSFRLGRVVTEFHYVVFQTTRAQMFQQVYSSINVRIQQTVKLHIQNTIWFPSLTNSCYQIDNKSKWILIITSLDSRALFSALHSQMNEFTPCRLTNGFNMVALTSTQEFKDHIFAPKSTSRPLKCET